MERHPTDPRAFDAPVGNPHAVRVQGAASEALGVTGLTGVVFDRHAGDDRDPRAPAAVRIGATARTARPSPLPASPDPIDRDEAKRLAKRAWVRAIDASGYTLEEVAAILQICPTRVRKQRLVDGADLDVVPNAADILLADPVLGELYLDELQVEREALHGTRSLLAPKKQLLRASSATARFQATVAEALEDDVLERHEVPAIEAARAAAYRELDDVGALFRAAKDLIR